MTPVYHKFSVVKFLPNEIVHEKKATIGGTFEHHTGFQGKEMSRVEKRERQNSLTLKFLFLVGFQQSLSCPSPLRGKELIKSRKV